MDGSQDFEAVAVVFSVEVVVLVDEEAGGVAVRDTGLDDDDFDGGVVEPEAVGDAPLEVLAEFEEDPNLPIPKPRTAGDMKPMVSATVRAVS